MEQADVPMYPGFILAGGASRRFGSDKARAVLGGKALITRVAAALGQRCSSVTVIAARADQYADLGLATIADRIPSQGPLGGLLTALAEPEVSSFAIVASCDLLALAPPLLDPLLRGGAPPVQAVVFRDAQLQPFPGLYHRSLLPLIETRLGQESRSIRDLLAHAATTVVPLPPGIPRVAQANTPADLPPFSRSQRKVRRKWLAAGFDDQSGDPGRRRRPSR